VARDLRPATVTQRDALRHGRLDEIDLEHIAEEIEDLGKSERSAARSQLHRILMHPIKRRIQPEKSGSSWRRSIAEGRAEVEFRLEDSPSLRRYGEQNLESIWRKAVKNALFETGQAEREDLDIPELTAAALCYLSERTGKPYAGSAYTQVFVHGDEIGEAASLTFPPESSARSSPRPRTTSGSWRASSRASGTASR